LPYRFRLWQMPCSLHWPFCKEYFMGWHFWERFFQTLLSKNQKSSKFSCSHISYAQRILQALLACFGISPDNTLFFGNRQRDNKKWKPVARLSLIWPLGMVEAVHVCLAF
ncbi:MAG TPA: hypothetical protein PKN81_11985, partial [Anaerolineales bacterium]|nr:hypothetical protein [Anaerolineales bacterium]